MAKTPHQRIMRAAERGTGLRLSADEVGRLSQDGAIRQAAAGDDAVEIAKQCTTCLSRILPPEGWHCAKRREAPFGACGDWKGAGE